MKLVRVIDTKRCMGCRACVAACAVENHFTPDAPWNVMIESESGKFPNVYRTFVTMNCMHCENPPCKTACDGVKAYAISKNEMGVVLIDYEKCIGCGYCAAVCPYGVPQLNQTVDPLYSEGGATPYEAIPDADRHWTHRKKAKVVEKCTFCWHRLEKAIEDGKPDRIGKDPQYTPACDLVCPVDARLFGDLDDPKSEVARTIGGKKASQLKREFGAAPQVYYVLEGGEK
ncbi:MAG: 4Fe-4S dicluster domain-containing protein [Candidatus Thiodiazotropha sp. (ex Lucinoma annulata)]|nr:4Fe-4S dicluster domain-containing protein [Candidatus Thiodiazotropha sp. (ex Lucinoma borealis)]MCU7840659.1 4Fe-4S dicluster domain-containing protein [Candidatus Thiodiazotropha sp. (ex Troendleina suluensis)]MCU7884242.1 4Fe-4S dicluster domain-containing protein [Candidatus Thiodiazotropha sp. (ex Lucinoma annulata)]MCU7855052.1 4Fe-4S dicluster domain-containing protein [Candidatus Thiodiazotropha sp. (ex Lucinoma borealis)]MCU7865606.1 4Fe-4S dicluster domain-containing protein [Cand